jgi:hypothetical protein
VGQRKGVSYSFKVVLPLECFRQGGETHSQAENVPKGQQGSFGTIKEINNSVYQTECILIVLDAMNLDTRWINHLEFWMIDTEIYKSENGK